LNMEHVINIYIFTFVYYIIIFNLKNM